MQKVANTWNFLVDYGLEEQRSSPANFVSAPAYKKPENFQITKQTQQEPEWKRLWLQSEDELKIMKWMKEDWFTAEEFSEAIIQYRKRQEWETKLQKDVEKFEQEPENLPWFDIWVKTWEAISWIWEKLKFQAEDDDRTITSFAKFLWNLPWDTVQLAWDLVSIVSNPVGTVQSVGDFAGSMVETGLNKAFWQDVYTSEERRIIADSVANELRKISDDPSILKDMVVENPTDVLLSVTGGLWAAKNAAKAKNLTGLASKLEKAEKITNPLKIQLEAIKAPARVIGKWGAKVTENLVDSTIQLRPTDSEKVLKATWDKTPAQWLLDKGILDDTKTVKWREGIVTELERFNKNQYETLNNAVKSAQWTFKNERVNQWIQSMLDELWDVPWVEDKFNRVKELQLKATRWEGLTLSEQLEVKRLIDNTLDLYKITWDPKTWAKKEGLVNIRQAIRETIENEAMSQGLWDVKALSNDVQVSRLIKDSLVNRINTVSSNNIFSLTDYLVWGTAFVWVDPTTAIALIAGKKIMSTPQFKIFATKTLNLPKKLINKIETGKDLASNEVLKVSWAVLEYIKQKGVEDVRKIINEQALKAKDSLWNKIDDLADKTGARAKFINDTGKSLDDFKEMGTTESANIRTVAESVDLEKIKWNDRIISMLKWEWFDWVKNSQWEFIFPKEIKATVIKDIPKMDKSNMSPLQKRFEKYWGSYVENMEVWKVDDIYKSGQKMGLDNQEMAALWAYIRNEYFPLNQALRKWIKNDTKMNTLKNMIDKWLDKVPNYKWVVYREWKLPREVVSQFNTGKSFTDKAYMSTSMSDDIVKEFKLPSTTKDYSVHYEIKTKTWKDISKINPSEEKEVLIKPNTEFRITEIRKVNEWSYGDRIYIKAEEI